MSKEKALPIETIARNGGKEVKEWKSKLTAALDDTVLLISLILLGCFYVFYTCTNYSLGGDTRDQDTITSGCSCRFTARLLYRLWFTMFLMIWIIVYSYISLERAFQGFIYCVPKCRQRDARDIQKCGNCMEAVTEFSFWRDQCCPPKTVETTDHESAYNEKLLWYQYYTLYIMGYTGTTEIKDNKHPSEPSEADYSCQNTICSITIRNFIRAMLLFLKYFSQLVTVPLLMLQMFDTYALLCFVPNTIYCGDLSEYRIHLLQVAITIFFYLSIASAQLISTLLEWAPLVKFSNQQQDI